MARVNARTDSAPSNGAEPYSIRAVDRVCDVLDALADAGGALNLLEIATSTGMPKSTAFRYLSALESRHYVVRSSEASNYRLGPAFRPQHTVALDQLLAIARPLLEDLRDELGETTNLGTLDGTGVVHALVCESRNPMRLAARIGDRGAVHSTALGKAICAVIPVERVEAIVNAVGLPRITERTITDGKAWNVELKSVRSLGYGVDDGENQRGGRCVGVSIPGIAIPAGISVSAPDERLTREMVPEVGRALRRVAEAIQRQVVG